MKHAVVAILLGLLSVAGCDSVPNSKPVPTAAGVKYGGVVAPPADAKNEHLLNVLTGGALGPGGGSLCGAQLSKTDPKHRDEAIQAAQKAGQKPATAADVDNSPTADLNRDGYVTLDEVVAMQKAGLTDQEMVRRLQATSQIFEVSAEQQKYLREHGVSDNVIGRMNTINQDVRDQANRDRNNRP